MRVMLDANVLVSGVLNPHGSPGRPPTFFSLGQAGRHGHQLHYWLNCNAAKTGIALSRNGTCAKYFSVQWFSLVRLCGIVK